MQPQLYGKLSALFVRGFCIDRLMAYGSLVLTPAQRQYCTTRQELLAVVRFTRQFRHYCWVGISCCGLTIIVGPGCTGYPID